MNCCNFIGCSLASGQAGFSESFQLPQRVATRQPLRGFRRLAPLAPSIHDIPPVACNVENPAESDFECPTLGF